MGKEKKIKLFFLSKTSIKRKSFKSLSAFTYIELLIVIAIIGLMAGFFVTQYPATQKRARDSKRKSDIKQYQIAMEAYANKKNGNYFEAPNDNLSSQCGALGLTNCPSDSVGNYGIYSNTTSYVLWSTLEQKDDSGNTKYFIVCSNGKTGELTTKPTDATCPL